MSIEQPKYELLEQRDDVEIRRYDPYNVARTLVSGSFEDAGNDGFRRLAGYIFGGNRTSQKISMTAPVIQELDSENESGGPKTLPANYWLTFTMPSSHTYTELPLPDDSRVEVVQVAEQIVAVISYKGGWSEKRYRQHEARLMLSLENNPDWTPKGEPRWARYNPPFTPWFMRRNEVGIEVVPHLARPHLAVQQ